MAVPPVSVEFTVAGLETVKQAFREVAAESEQTTESIKKMDINYKSLALQVAHVGTAFLAMEGTLEKVSEGQMSLIEGALRLLPMIISIAGAVWNVVKALKWATIAQAVYKAVSTLGLALPLIAAAGIAGYALGTTLTGTIPEREQGGPIYETGFYKLHAGEYVMPSTSLTKVIRNRMMGETKTTNVTININGMTRSEAEGTSDVMIDRLRRAGVI